MFSRTLIRLNTTEHDAAEEGRFIDPPQVVDEFNMTPLEVGAIKGHLMAETNIESARQNNKITTTEEVRLWLLLACGRTIYHFENGKKYIQRAIEAAKREKVDNSSPWFMQWKSLESAILELGEDVDITIMKEGGLIDVGLFEYFFDKSDLPYQVSSDDIKETTQEDSSGQEENKVNDQGEKDTHDDSIQDKEDDSEGEDITDDDDDEDDEDRDHYESQYVIATMKYDQKFFENNRDVYLCALACAEKLLGEDNWYVLHPLVELMQYDFVPVRTGLKILVHCAEKLWHPNCTQFHLRNRRYLYAFFLSHTDEMTEDGNDQYAGMLGYSWRYYQQMFIIAVKELFMEPPLANMDIWEAHREGLMLIIAFLLSHLLLICDCCSEWNRLPEIDEYVNKLVNVTANGNTMLHYLLTGDPTNDYDPGPKIRGNHEAFETIIEEFLRRGFSEFFVKTRIGRKSVLDVVYELEKPENEVEREFLSDHIMQQIKDAAEKHQATRPPPPECRLLSASYYEE